jgi:hypothetical protein
LLTRISSGQLSGVGKYNICSGTRDAIVRHHQKAEVKQHQQQIKRSKRERKLCEKYDTSKSKAMNNENTLTVDDIKTLLLFHCCSDDSLLKVKVKDLKQQWQRRRHRLFATSSVHMTFDTQRENDVSTSNGDTPFEGNNHLLCSTTIRNNDQAEQIDNTSSSIDISRRNDYDCEEIEVAEFLSFIDTTTSSHQCSHTT